MAYQTRRPLPIPPQQDLTYDYPGGPGPRASPYPSSPTGQQAPISSADIYARPNYIPHYGYPSARSPISSPTTSPRDDPLPPTPSYLAGGTLLHKGFYDLLALIPSTPSPSRFWGGFVGGTTVAVAGPRYDQIPAGAAIPVQTGKAPPVVVPLRKNRRISKDMVSNPTRFQHLVHASDAEQAEALLTRWGPDGVGKVGNPQWANPIKQVIRENMQARAIASVVNTTAYAQPQGPLRVVNGMPSFSTVTASTITTRSPQTPGGVYSPTSPLSRPLLPNSSPTADGGLPPMPVARPLQPHDEDEVEEEESLVDLHISNTISRRALAALPRPPRPIDPSLATLEKAVSARIYFENLYFPLFRHPPSREQRRLAMEKEMEGMKVTEGQKREIRERWRRNETEYLRERRSKVDVSSFMKLKTIGHGAFGVVSLVREMTTGQLYAMKQLRKTDMLRKGQEGHVRAERDVLKGAALVSSPGGAEWIVRMFYSFQDRDHLYLVLEFMGGGDLLNLLIERDVFDEDFARFYTAEMILAIEQCHKQGFIHRDIKPDNFLFDPEGHIKLSDFGLATDLHWAHDTSYYEQQRRDLLRKHGVDLEDGGADGSKTRRLDRKEVDRIMGGGDGQGVFTWREKNRKKLAYSVCGTNSYMSPEVIRGHGYSFSCDWWSLGVILFECLYGYPPFVSNSRHVTRQKILNWKQSLRFPSKPRVSHEGVSLMEQLLCEPEDRLGSQASASVSRPDSQIVQSRRSGFYPNYGVQGNKSVDGAEYIKAHPWFRGIDWENIHKYPAPYRPELKNPEDTRHFDQDIPPEPLAPANGAAPDATRDPLLKDKVHGQEIMDVRKALAFAGFTHKSPRVISYARLDKVLMDPKFDDEGAAEDAERGRKTVRERGTVRGRAISM